VQIKGQNPLHQFPRSKSVTSPQHKRLVRSKSATSWRLPRLRRSYGETGVMDVRHTYKTGAGWSVKWTAADDYVL